MSDIDDDLREDVNNALEDEQIDEPADHDQDDIADDDSPEDEANDDQVEDEDDDSRDRKPTGKDTTRSAPADDEDLEEDDDPSLDYARPDFTPNGSSAQVKEFDIRTLPKDPETGLIDPVEANRLINEFYANQGKSSSEAAERERKTQDLLTQQWTRVSKKYKEVYSNPRLRDLARDMHLNSIGTDSYLTPAQAAAKIERTRRELVKTGYKSAKTRRSVETMTRTERGSGRPSGGSLNDYEKAKAKAASRDPQKAKAGRMELLRIRREARRRSN